MFLVILALLLAPLYLFIFWRKLREDYYQESLFSLGTVHYLILLLISALAELWGAKTYYYLDIIFVLIAYVLIGKWFKRDAANKLEIAEGMLLAYWVFSLVWAVAKVIFGAYTIIYIFEAGLSLASLVFFVIINKNYKKFDWYKSGRVGIAGVTTLGVGALVKGAVVLIFPKVFPFPLAALFFGVFAFVNFMLVYKLANKLS